MEDSTVAELQIEPVHHSPPPSSVGSKRLSNAVCIFREPLGQHAWAAERDVVAALHLVSVDAEALTRVPARPGGWEHAVVTAEEVPRRRVRPGLQRPGLLERLRVLAPFPPSRLGGERGRDVVVEDVLVTALFVPGVCPPVCEELAGCGIIAATRTRRSTGTCAVTRGAVKPPSECPTTTRSLWSPTAWTTVPAYCIQPAEASSQGRSTAIASCPCSRSGGATRCQSHELPPPPWMSANVATQRGQRRPADD